MPTILRIFENPSNIGRFFLENGEQYQKSVSYNFLYLPNVSKTLRNLRKRSRQVRLLRVLKNRIFRKSAQICLGAVMHPTTLPWGPAEPPEREIWLRGMAIAGSTAPGGRAGPDAPGTHAQVCYPCPSSIRGTQGTCARRCADLAGSRSRIWRS